MKETVYHLIGIGGIGMSALARLLKQSGKTVQGSDRQFSKMLGVLKDEGIAVQVGHSSDHIPENATIVYSSAIQDQNPEMSRARRLNLECLHRSDLLSRFSEGKKAIVVTGAHGKTTTSSLVSWVLYSSEKNPSFALGGILAGLETNARWGTGSHFVIEGDESDGSFLKPKVEGAIVTNFENEHLDYWKTSSALIAAYRDFLLKVENPELLFWCYDDVNLRELSSKGVSYGFQKGADIQVCDVEESAGLVTFDLQIENESYAKVQLSAFGRFNALNAAAVFGLCLRLGVTEDEIRKAFLTFPGVKRRLEKKGEVHQTYFYDDYAHHPTEISATLQALKKQFPVKRVVAVFQPHRYSRVRDFFQEFTKCFSAADEVVVTDIYSAGESPLKDIHARKLAEAIVHPRVQYVSTEDVIDYLQKKIRPYDVVITLGAGNITTIGEQIVDEYRQHPQRWKVALIYGGRSVEHEIALRSAAFVRNHLDPIFYDVEEFYVDQMGNWEGERFHSKVLEKLQNCELAFPVFHGSFGEDGMIQGFLETLAMPYVGCDYHSSVLAMNKDWTKLVASREGIATPKFVVHRKGLTLNLKDLQFPLWVKAVHLGSSLGVYRTENMQELEEKIKEAFKYDTRLIIEEEIQGRQIEYGIIGNGEVETGVACEIMCHGNFHDYDSKYSQKSAENQIPPNLSEEKLEEGKAIAEAVYKACGFAGFTRVDLFLDPEGKFWFNEANPIPGMTPTSPFPSMWSKKGVEGNELVNRLLLLALQRHLEEERLQTKR